MNVIRLAAVLAVSALLAAACSSSDDAAPAVTVPTSEASSTTSTTSASTTSTTTEAPDETTDEELIADLVERYWRTGLVEASNPPDPAADLWDDIVIPSLLPVLQDLAQRNLDANRGVDGIDPDQDFVLAEQISIVDALGIVFLCLRDESRIYDVSSGETTEEVLVVVLKRMEVINGEAGWRVASSESLERFEQGEVDACVAQFPSP